ncbi:hypothetical protein LINGRAHAP2_LOCUS24873 [Linum grandiflorum]
MAVRPTANEGVGTNQCGGEVIPFGATVRCFAFSDLDLDFSPMGTGLAICCDRRQRVQLVGAGVLSSSVCKELDF